MVTTEGEGFTEWLLASNAELNASYVSDNALDTLIPIPLRIPSWCVHLRVDYPYVNLLFLVMIVETLCIR